MPGFPEQQPPKSENKTSLQERKFAKHNRQKSVATLTYILTHIKANRIDQQPALQGFKDKGKGGKTERGLKR